jgi:hypothetical protein
MKLGGATMIGLWPTWRSESFNPRQVPGAVTMPSRKFVTSPGHGSLAQRQCSPL